MTPLQIMNNLNVLLSEAFIWIGVIFYLTGLKR